MRNKIIQAGIVLSGLILVSMSFQNCGPQGLVQLSSEDPKFEDPCANGCDPVEKFNQRNEMKVLTSDQVFQSMSSLTGVDLGNTAAQNDWKNNRTNTLADNFSLNAITAPLLLNTTNLAGIFCDEAIKAEMAAGATRRLFVGVNFAGQVSALSGASYVSLLQNLAQVFWGRPLTAGEQTLLEQARTAHDAAIVAAQRNNVNQTRFLAHMVCTAMLSSNDSFTF
jgi:hypothetical protein